MSKHERGTREHRGEHAHRGDSVKYDRNDRNDRVDRVERESRKERDSRRRRHRSPSYDSYDSSDSSSDSDREPSPRRPSRRHTTAYSDGEDRGYRGRDSRRRNRDYYSPSPSPERKGIVEDLLGAIGLVQSKNKSRSGGHSSSRDIEERQKNTKQALQAALTAAAMEAFRTRKEGKLTPQRLLQIAGAAVAAGGLDALVDRSGGENSGLRRVLESVVAGLATGKTMGSSIKQKRGGSMDNKIKTGMVGAAAKQILGRSLSRGAHDRRSRTNKW